MATKKITDLVEITTAASDDVLPIVDVSLDITNKITTTNLLKGKQDLLESGTNIKTINSTSLLGSGDISIQANPSGGAGAIQFSDGSAFASDSNLFWDDTNKRLGIGTSSPTRQLSVSSNAIIRDLVFGITGATAISNTSNYFVDVRATGIGIGQGGSTFATSSMLHVRGSGSTSATTALLVQNSSGSSALQITDDLKVITPSIFETGTTNGFVFNSNAISTKINGFLTIDKNANREFRITDTNFTRNYIVIQSSSASNFADITFNTNHLAIKKEGNVGFGTATPNVSAILDVTSTTKGFLPPRMTTTEKNAISSPAAGLQVYDTTLNQMSYYNGSSWINF